MTMTKLWEPSAERIAPANLTAFATVIATRHGVDVRRLTRSSGAGRSTTRRSSGAPSGTSAACIGVAGERVLVDADRMPGARWFPDARLNFAQNLLERRRADDDGDALVFWGEDKVKRRVSHAQLHARCVAGLRRACDAWASRTGDRVAAYMPNMPETIIAMLGAAARGAIWSSCSPDFGVQGVLDRFGQIEPRVLFTVDGYCYNGKADPDPRQGRRDRRAAAVGRARGRRALPAARAAAAATELSSHPRRARRGTSGSRRSPPGRSTTRSCRSTIRSTSSIPRAPPACPSASCTAPAARCCSTSRSIGCTAT